VAEIRPAPGAPALADGCAPRGGQHRQDQSWRSSRWRTRGRQWGCLLSPSRCWWASRRSHCTRARPASVISSSLRTASTASFTPPPPDSTKCACAIPTRNSPIASGAPRRLASARGRPSLNLRPSRPIAGIPLGIHMPTLLRTTRQPHASPTTTPQATRCRAARLTRQPLVPSPTAGSVAAKPRT
jgi:hypothetical protein